MSEPGAPRGASGTSVRAVKGMRARSGRGAGIPPPPSPCRAPAPAHPVALSLSISANRLQTERARRWVNAIGALPGAQATLPARPPPGQTSQPAPRRPSQRSRLRPSAARRNLALAGAPQPNEARRVPGGQGARHPGSRCYWTRECARLAGPG